MVALTCYPSWEERFRVACFDVASVAVRRFSEGIFGLLGSLAVGRFLPAYFFQLHFSF